MKITRILLVEDDIDIAELYVSSLTKAGYTVETVRDGDDALELIKTFNPQLILMDILIPGKSGLEVTHILRTDPSYNALTTAIIMLTNLNYDMAGARAEEDNILDYIVKVNVTPKMLVARIAEFETGQVNIPSADQM